MLQISFSIICPKSYQLALVKKVISKVKEHTIEDLRDKFSCEINLQFNLSTTEKRKMKWWIRNNIASRRGELLNF